MSHLSCRVGIGGIRELLDGKIWEWDLSFRWKWEWEWSHWNGRELVRKICSRTPLLGSQPAGDVNHKFSGRLPWLSARPAVIPATLKEGCYQFRCLVNRGTMGVNSLSKTVTRQHRDCDLNPGPSVPESSTLTTRLPSNPEYCLYVAKCPNNVTKKN